MLDQIRKMKTSQEEFLDRRVFSFVETHTHKPAVVFEDDSLSYEGLRGYASSLANELIAQGVSVGDYVVVLLPPGIEITASLLAIHMVGAVYVPLDVEHPLPSIEEKIELLNAKYVLTTSQFRDRFSPLSLNTLLCDRFRDESCLPFCHEVKRNANDDACVFFTSGSSGKPKGVVGSYKAMFDSIVFPAEYLGFSENDTLNSIARFTWSISMLELLAPLVYGGTSLLLGRERIQDLSKLYESTLCCSAFHCPPGLLRKLANYILEENLNLPDSMRLVWYGGDLFSTAQIETLHKAFPRALVGTAYGCTEIFGLSHCFLYQRGQVNKVLIGKPVGNIEQLILNEKRETTNSGELLLGGDRVASNYFGDAELTKKKFITIEGERYFVTGDFVESGQEEELAFLERRDDQVKIRGIRVELGEIEHVVSTIDGVKDVAVLAVSVDPEDSSMEKQLQVYISSNLNVELREEQVRASISEKLPSYMMPNLVYILDELPMTENFKIDKKKLVQLGKEVGSDVEGGFATEVEHRLAGVWEHLLKKKPTSSQDNFFNIGGDSLSAIHLASALTKEFSLSVSVAEIYKKPRFQDQVVIVSRTDQQQNTVDFAEIFASPAQSGLFFREMFERKGASITCSRYILHSKGYDYSVVESALGVLLERYPTLRTNIQLGENRKLLLIERGIRDLSETVILKNEIISLDGKEVIKASKINHKFNLKSGSLICAIISPASSGGEVLQLTVHHIAADDASAGRLAKDFVCIYDALLNSNSPDLMSVSFPFSKFLLEQEAKFKEGYFDSDALKLSAVLEKFNTKENSALIEPEEGLFESEFSLPFGLGSQEHTAFVESLAALAQALYFALDKEELVFCSHVSLQRDSYDSPQVGMFINLVPIVTGYDPSHSALDHVQRVAHDLAEAMSRSDIPFELIKNSSEKLRKLKKYPFDAYVNELVFDDEYLPGYEALVVPRSFATDNKVLSVTLLKVGEKESFKIEVPGRQAATSMKDLQGNITSFLGSIHVLGAP